MDGLFIPGGFIERSLAASPLNVNVVKVQQQQSVTRTTSDSSLVSLCCQWLFTLARVKEKLKKEAIKAVGTARYEPYTHTEHSSQFD